MGGASWWGRSKARACAPGKITYGKSDPVLPLKKFAVCCLNCPVFLNSDYGFYRNQNTSECVREAKVANKTLELCLHGEEDELLTAGWPLLATWCLASCQQASLQGAHKLVFCVTGTARSPVTSARVGSRLSWQSRQLSGPAALSQAHVHRTALQLPSHTLTRQLVDMLSYSHFLPLFGFSFVKQSGIFCSFNPKNSSVRSWCWSWCVLGQLSLSWWLLFRP